jgi:hypothetical protein
MIRYKSEPAEVTRQKRHTPTASTQQRTQAAGVRRDQLDTLRRAVDGVHALIAQTAALAAPKTRRYFWQVWRPQELPAAWQKLLESTERGKHES